MNKHFKVIDSTSTYLKRNYLKMKHLTFVDASFQTAGKGRMNRTWFGGHDSLMFSYLIKENNLMTNFSSLSILTAVSILKVLENLNIEGVYIKWPNDVYIKNKKVAGILLEGVSLNNNLQVLIIGVGLNVNQLSFNDEISSKATSLKLEGCNIKVGKLKKILYRQIKRDIKAFINGDRSYLQIANNHNYLLNKRVFATISNQKTEILALSINQDNSLLCEINGQKVSINTDEITFQ